MKGIYYLFIGFLFIACIKEREQNNIERFRYSRDFSVSDSLGIPKDKRTLYFPDSMYNYKPADSILFFVRYENKGWSSLLYIAREPVLYNFYLKKDIYRFSWSRAFHEPIIISLIKENNKVMIQWKKIRLGDGRIQYIEDGSTFQKKDLSLDCWAHFEKILDEAHYWEMLPYYSIIGLDGSTWIIEAHLEDKYWFVNRWAPRDNFQKCGMYLIELSGLKEEIY